MRAAIYVRISSDPEGQRAGVERQREDCERECTRRGWEFEVFEDNDASAYGGKRRVGYQAMLTEVEAKRVGAVVAWAPDRLTRHLRELETLIDTVERAGCQLVTVQAGDWDLTTPEGRFMARQLGLLARLEAEKIASRVSRQRRAAAEAGNPHVGGRRPWGFGSDYRTVDPVEAEEIRDAARSLLAGQSLTTVAKRVGRQPTSVRKALLAPRMAGKRKYRGQVLPGNFEAILDEDTWLAVKAALDGRKRGPLEPGGSRGRKYLLSGWVRCGVCGSRMAGGGGGKIPAYKCVMACVSRRADLLDDVVRDWILARADLQLPAEGVDPGLLAAVQGFEARIADLDREFDEGVEGMSAAVYARARSNLEARLAEAQTTLDEAERAVSWVDARGEGYSWWEKADLRQRRIEVAKYVERVVVNRTTKGPRFIEADVLVDPKTKP